MEPTAGRVRRKTSCRACYCTGHRTQVPVAVVPEQCPSDIDEPASEGDDGLDVSLVFGAFTLIELSRGTFALCAAEGGHVEHVP